jgi:nitrite reductase/ring-hydroxylating ferredoxin subunit
MGNKMKKLNLAEVKSINPDTPYYAIASNTDLVLIKSNETDEVFVLYGRCQHRGALMSDGRVMVWHVYPVLHLVELLSGALRVGLLLAEVKQHAK